MWEGVRIKKIRRYEDAKCVDCGTGAVMESSGVPDTASASVVAPLPWYLHFEAILPQITKAPLASLFPFVLM